MFVGFTYVLYHPWFVCTQPDRNGFLVAVNVTDAERAQDKTCILRRGDHQLIIKDSAVYYDLAELRSLESFKVMIDRKTIKPGEPASDELIVRIRQGAIDSAHTPNDVRVAVIRCPWKPREPGR